MRCELLCSITILAISATPVLAQQAPAKEAVGTWNGKSMVGPKDSVVITYVLKVAPDGKSATITFPGRDPVTMKVIAMGGDSIVTEAGPYESALRKGQMVNSLRTVAHVSGDMMTGTFETKYASGEVLKGKTQASRAK